MCISETSTQCNDDPFLLTLKLHRASSNTSVFLCCCHHVFFLTIKGNNCLFGIPTVLEKKLKRMITNHPAILAINSKKTERLLGLWPCLFVQKLLLVKPVLEQQQSPQTLTLAAIQWSGKCCRLKSITRLFCHLSKQAYHLTGLWDMDIKSQRDA